MPTDHLGDPWPGTTYRGFADVNPGEARRTRRLTPAAMVAAGVAAALVLGVLFGLLARPRLNVDRPPAAHPAAPAAAAPVEPAEVASAGQVPIAVKPAPKPAPLHSNGPLQVLPPQMAHTGAPAPRPAHRAPPPPDAALDGSGPYFTGTAQPPAQAPAQALAPAASDAAAPAAQPAARPHASFDCATARGGAEQDVCSSPELASADRAMARAYRRALRASPDPDALRAEQQDWMAIREDAARHSPRAVASVYAQRIRELNQMAASDRGGDEDYPDGDQ